MNGDDLTGRRVFVIGGEMSLGRAIVVGLAEAGADVAIASLTPDTQAEFAINSALNELWALDRNGVALAIDASDAEMLRRALEEAESELGGLDVVAPIGDRVASEALAGHTLVQIGENDDEGEALMAISERLVGGGQS